MLKNNAFEPWLAHLITFEGGRQPQPGESIDRAYELARPTAWSCDEADPGGATMCGITLRVFRIWRQAFMHMPAPTAADLRAMDYGEWEQIVETLYWRFYKLHTVPYDCLALCFAENIFMSGRAGIREIQAVLGCTPDGVIGPSTIGAMRHRIRTREEARATCHLLLARRMERLRQLPRFARYGRGWERRAAATLAKLGEMDLTIGGE